MDWMSLALVLLLATGGSPGAAGTGSAGGGAPRDALAEAGEGAVGSPQEAADPAEVEANEPGEEGPLAVPGGGALPAERDDLILDGESHFASLVQYTNGGENAEAYWSWAGDALVLQATERGGGCDQIYELDLREGVLRLVSTGKGRTTCSYYMPGDRHIVFSSTHLASPDCPPTPDMSLGYTWPIYDSYDIFVVPRAGGPPARLTETAGYDAEATVGPDGSIVFTSVRDGDLELYRMDADGKNVRRLTRTPGYDGGAFFSPDGRQICYRAYHPTDEKELSDYRALLSKSLVRPGKLEIWVMDADGSNARPITSNGAANFCPFFHPSGRKIIFSSNLDAPRSRNFDLYMVDLEGGGLERITHEPEFDGFPMFSPDGKRLVFCSNRGNEREGETNVFVADWKD